MYNIINELHRDLPISNNFIVIVIDRDFQLYLPMYFKILNVLKDDPVFNLPRIIFYELNVNGETGAYFFDGDRTVSRLMVSILARDGAIAVEVP